MNHIISRHKSYSIMLLFDIIWPFSTNKLRHQYSRFEIKIRRKKLELIVSSFKKTILKKFVPTKNLLYFLRGFSSLKIFWWNCNFWEIINGINFGSFWRICERWIVANTKDYFISSFRTKILWRFSMKYFLIYQWNDY